MTDAPSLKPKWQFLLGLLPSINTSLIAVVTALVSIGGTLATQRMTTARPEPAKAAADLSPILAELTELKERMILVEGYSSLAVDRLLQLGDDPRTPRGVAVKKLARPLPKAIDTSTR